MSMPAMAMAGSTAVWMPLDKMKSSIIRISARLRNQYWSSLSPVEMTSTEALEIMTRLRGLLPQALAHQSKSVHFYQRDSTFLLPQPLKYSLAIWMSRARIKRLSCPPWTQTRSHCSSIRSKFWGSRRWGRSGRNSFRKWASAWTSRTTGFSPSPTEPSNNATLERQKRVKMRAYRHSNQRNAIGRQHNGIHQFCSTISNNETEQNGSTPPVYFRLDSGTKEIQRVWKNVIIYR